VAQLCFELTERADSHPPRSLLQQQQVNGSAAFSFMTCEHFCFRSYQEKKSAEMVSADFDFSSQLV
jgi:hypothetical protein